MIVMKRVYDPPEKGDGVRVLVDRLWPRGLSRDKAAVDHWIREIAPEAELRRWYGHREERWEEFRARYRAELDGKEEMVRQILNLARGRRVTLLYAAHNPEHNNARVLLEYLREKSPEEVQMPA